MLRLSSILFGLVASVLAGVALMIVLAVPAFSERAVDYIPYSIACAFALALPITWLLARQIVRQSQSAI